MSKISGKIVNPVSVVGDVISEIETPINLNVGTDMNYQASSLSTFLKTDTALFLPTDLSQIDTIFLLSKPEKYGQSIFRDRLSEKTIPINLKGNKSVDSKLQTTIYTINPSCAGKTCPAFCTQNFTYIDENGNTISDSVTQPNTITFCAAEPPIFVGGTCNTSFTTIDSTICNNSDSSVTENNQILYIDRRS